MMMPSEPSAIKESQEYQSFRCTIPQQKVNCYLLFCFASLVSNLLIDGSVTKNLKGKIDYDLFVY